MRALKDFLLLSDGSDAEPQGLCEAFLGGLVLAALMAPLAIMVYLLSP